MTQLELVTELRKQGAKEVDFNEVGQLLHLEFYPPEPPVPVLLDKATADVYEDMKRHADAADERLLYHSA